MHLMRVLRTQKRSHALVIRRNRKKSGQGMTEYAAILAFVAVLLSAVFSMFNGPLASSISASYSTASDILGDLTFFIETGAYRP
jgi:Flp pilus assembly pilin Flp